MFYVEKNQAICCFGAYCPCCRSIVGFFHKKQYGHLRQCYKASACSALVAFSGGVGCTLCANGNFCRHNLYKPQKGSGSGPERFGRVCRKPFCKLFMEHNIFQLPRFFIFLHMAMPFMASCFENNYRIPKSQLSRGLSTAPIPSLDNLRRLS